MSFFDPQNPGISGIDELTPTEEIFLTTLAGNGGTPNLTLLVPYTGATTDVDLGTHSITANNAVIGGATINSSGYIGIGIDPSVYPFSIQDSANVMARYISTDQYAAFLLQDNVGGAYIATKGGDIRISPNLGSLASPSLTINTNGTVDLTPADSSGLTDLYINPTAKTSGYLWKADVNGSNKAYLTYNAELYLRSGGWLHGGGNIDITSGANNTMNIRAGVLNVLQSWSVASGDWMTIGTYTGAQYLTASTGNQNFLTIEPNINQTGDAGYTVLNLDATETGLGSGTNYILSGNVASVNKFSFDTSGALQMDGHLAVGNNISDLYNAYIYNVSTADNTANLRLYHQSGNYNSTRNLFYYGYANPTSGTVATYANFFGYGFINPSAGATVTAFYNQENILRANGTGNDTTNAYNTYNSIVTDADSMNITHAYNYYSTFTIGANTTVSSAYSYYASSPIINGTITSAYGLYIGSISGASTNNYAIYTNDGDVRFGDNVSIIKADSSGDTDLLINPTTKTSGNLIDAQVNSVSKFSVDNNGNTTLVGELLLSASTTARPSLNIPSGTAPSSPTDGDIWYDSTINSLIHNIAGINETLGGLLFVQTASGTVANTTSETALESTGIETLTLPANLLKVGKTIQIKASGHYSTANPAGTLRIRIKFGTTVILDTGAQTMSNGISNYTWSLDTSDITCRSTGATGTVMANGFIQFATSAIVANSVEFTANTSPITIDTTQSQTITITATWGTADASNTITMTNLEVQSLN